MTSRPPHRSTPDQREVCKRCYRTNCIEFSVPDAAWVAVVRDRWNTLCPLCFDEVAKAAGVPYEFATLLPVTWSMRAEEPDAKRC